MKLFLNILVIFGIWAASTAQARDMHGRFGLGYNGQFSNSTPGISMKYGLTRDVAAELVAGVATSTPSDSVFALKFFKNVFFEQNLNFYFMLGGGLVSANDVAGADILGGFGAEFFLPGIESLGFSIEAGAIFSSISGSFVLRTIGMSFLAAGIHFYF